MNKNYDVIIIGGGPAGLSAGIYASRGGLRTLLVEKGMFGGLIANADLVENYPGFPEGISGFEIGERMSQQAAKFGLETLAAEVTGVDLLKDIKTVSTSEGEFSARAIIIAAGAERKRLGEHSNVRLVNAVLARASIIEIRFLIPVDSRDLLGLKLFAHDYLQCHWR